MRTVSMQHRAAAWHTYRYPTATHAILVAKLTEETGELARAFVADWEGRLGRGNVPDEAAQIVCVLLSLIGRFYPDHDLLDDVYTELERCGA